MTEKLKLGIVGMGTIGTVHAAAHQAVGRADVQAICDINGETLAKTGDRFGVKNRFERYQELLESDVEAVMVCVGNTLHREMAVAALEAGKHVFLEKPMAMNAKEAADIVAAARTADTILQIGMVRRCAPEVRIARQWAEEGLFGQVYHMRTVMVRRRGIPGLGGWFTTMAESGGGPMIDLGVHWFDAAMHVSGLWKPTSVSAKTYAKFGPKMDQYKYVSMWAGPPKLDGVFDVEDYSTGFVRFGRQATLSLEIAWAANTEGESFIEILGDQGGVRIGGGSGLQLFTEHAGRLADIAPKYDDGQNSFETQAETFVAACRRESPPNATGAEGLTVMKLIDAIYASSQADAEVPIDT